MIRGDEKVPDYLSMDYIRGNPRLFPPASRDAPFDSISISSTIVQLSGLDINTTFMDLGSWLDGICAFQGVICPLGEGVEACIERAV